MQTPIRYRWVIEPVRTRAPRAGNGTNGDGRWAPAMDVFETEAAYTIEMDLPGVAPESVELVFEQGELVIAGQRERADVGAALRAERPAGAFRRTLQLEGVAPDRIRATSTHGVLRIEVPKAETAKPRRIPVAMGEPAQV